MKKDRFGITLIILSILLIISFGVTLCWGTYEISPLDVVKTLLGNGTRLQNTAIFTIRLPRLLVGAFVGIALSTAGAIVKRY